MQCQIEKVDKYKSSYKKSVLVWKQKRTRWKIKHEGPQESDIGGNNDKDRKKKTIMNEVWASTPVKIVNPQGKGRRDFITKISYLKKYKRN